MNIPEEYRERYDSLARSHPWMREMRDEWMQSDFVNCGNPYREGDAVLDATIITSMRDETNGIPSETNGIAYDSPLVEPSEGDAVAILREASGSDVSNLLLINTTKSYDVEEAYTKLADMVERNYVRLSEYERACHDAQTLYLQAEAERDDLQGRVDYLESRHCEWSDPNDLGDGCMLRHDELVDKLRAERDELTKECSALDKQCTALEEELERVRAERDELREENEALREWKACYERMRDERDYWKLHTDCWADKCKEAEAERDELKAEVDAYRSKYDDMEFIVPIDKAMEFTTDPPGYVKKALADMHERIITLTAECGEYREKLSRALDLAHEIGRLQP